jgi:hypothetical protein
MESKRARQILSATFKELDEVVAEKKGQRQQAPPVLPTSGQGLHVSVDGRQEPRAGKREELVS